MSVLKIASPERLSTAIAKCISLGCRRALERGKSMVLETLQSDLRCRGEVTELGEVGGDVLRGRRVDTHKHTHPQEYMLRGEEDRQKAQGRGIIGLSNVCFPRAECNHMCQGDKLCVHMLTF